MIGASNRPENSQKVSLALNSVYTWVDSAGHSYLVESDAAAVGMRTEGALPVAV